VTRQQGSRVQLSRLVPVNPAQPLRPFPTHKQGPWNVVLFVMESVGTRYMFDQSHGNPVPMPFLRDLAQKSWYLKKHYTTSNVSTKAVFSILSGLYDLFGREDFGTREDTVVPSIYNFFRDSHQCFLVTPASLAWYFPAAFIRNSGLPEVHHYGNLNFRIREEVHSSLGRYIGRDEVQTTDFFVRRLEKAAEPFFGIYISFAAHFPYFDYGPEYRIMENDGELVTRYYNNLYLLDRMIQRVYDALRNQGRLERTIFVIVGDHGQAFGQHQPDNFMHYRYSRGRLNFRRAMWISFRHCSTPQGCLTTLRYWMENPCSRVD
jgi:membrane-anchored protein YejM (alkaline phosphatase superfamily)